MCNSPLHFHEWIFSDIYPIGRESFILPVKKIPTGSHILEPFNHLYGKTRRRQLLKQLASLVRDTSGDLGSSFTFGKVLKA